jgi:uncharacterized damage-inducible protein DinB
MRTPKELLVHMYGMLVKNIPVGIAKGNIEGLDEAPIVASLKTKEDVLRYCRDCWQAGDTSTQSITDAQLQAIVTTPWNKSFPGWVAGSVISDEYMHHRGQLYAYARALGLDVPMVWDFAGNEADFRPKATAQA